MIARFLLLALLLITSAVQAAAAPATLKPPADRHIRVAFVMTEGATMIDFAGPWEVFQDVHVPERGQTSGASLRMTRGCFEELQRRLAT